MVATGGSVIFLDGVAATGGLVKKRERVWGASRIMGVLNTVTHILCV